MPTLAVIALALLSLVAGFLVEPPAARAAKRKTGPAVASAAVAVKPDDQDGYRIVSEDISQPAGVRSVAVTVPKRIGEAELARIADLVRAREKVPHEKTVVEFYLPGMKIGAGAGAWAVATYQPSLKVAIIGLRLDEEQAAIAEAASDRRNVVGVWLMAPPAAPGRLTIYREGARTFGEWRLRDGTLSVEELIEARDGRGRRLTPAAGSPDYYLLGWNGGLELRDNSSLIATAERLPGFGERTPSKSGTAASRSRASSRDAGSADAGQTLSDQLFKF
jgi:hypothetical protein